MQARLRRSACIFFCIPSPFAPHCAPFVSVAPVSARLPASPFTSPSRPYMAALPPPKQVFCPRCSGDRGGAEDRGGLTRQILAPFSLSVALSPPCRYLPTKNPEKYLDTSKNPRTFAPSKSRKRLLVRQKLQILTTQTFQTFQTFKHYEKVILRSSHHDGIRSISIRSARGR